MFVPNNYDYMQDMYFYNQNPNTYINSFQTQNNVMQNQTTNLSYFYPSIYKLVAPVTLKVISNSNLQYINEDVINNLADTVYNIVEGDTKSNTTIQNESNYQNNNQKQTDKNDNMLLKDLIKILVIKELQNRQIRQLNNMYYQI